MNIADEIFAGKYQFEKGINFKKYFTGNYQL